MSIAPRRYPICPPRATPHRPVGQFDEGGSCSFLKKRTKKLLVIWAEPCPEKPKPKQTKVFCFFFSKKKALPLPACLPPIALRRGE
jgi:hypothetical protein